VLSAFYDAISFLFDQKASCKERLAVWLLFSALPVALCLSAHRFWAFRNPSWLLTGLAFFRTRRVPYTRVHIDMDASTVADEMSSLAPSSPRSQYGVQQWSQEENLPSRGSSLHELGQCKPCAWFWKEGGCDRFADCDYCHLCDLSTLEASVKERRRETRRVKRQQARCAKASSREA